MAAPRRLAGELASAADSWETTAWDDLALTEVAVVGFFDPATDIERRAARWIHRLPDHALPSLLRFAAGLAQAESEAWERDDPVIATQAYEDRRFLVADRVVHWAVPALDAAGRCYPEFRDTAHAIRDLLLNLGDEYRIAPALTGDEGLFPPGEDSFGPVYPMSLEPWLGSLWSGLVILDGTVRSLTSGSRDRSGLGRLLSDEKLRSEVALLYQVAAARWRSLAAAHPGSARLWHHLGLRAGRTSAQL